MGSRRSRSSKGIVLLGSVFVVVVLASPAATAQSFEAGAHLAVAQWSEFDGTDVGFGGRFTFKPSSLLGVDADLTWYPSDFPGDDISFSGSRFEGLFGVTAGPRLNRIRPFAKAAAGLLRSSAAPRPFACITIFPPPLVCLMGEGQTMPAFEFGGGVEIDATDRTFLRVDAGARMLLYPGPSFADRELRDEDFWGTAFRFAIGLGFRFQ
jgi:hypothetical protein